MRLGDQSPDETVRRLSGGGLALRTGPFAIRLRSRLPVVHRGISLMYADHPLLEDGEFCDHTLTLNAVPGLRRIIRPQVRLHTDGDTPFEPLPAGHAFALFEWSLNWCISSTSHVFLILHAAVVERGGFAAILPAPPGSGKSTLCAGLVQRGWRLLSDELALISLQTGTISALARPVSLKNESEQVIRRFAPQAVFGDLVADTTKGALIHLKAKPDDVARMDEPAIPRWIVFPRYVSKAPAQLTPRLKADAMIELGSNAFNYALLGEAGFEALGNVISSSDCYDFSYGHLDEAVQVFDALAQQRGA